MEYTSDDFLNEQTKEQLIIFLHNTELQLEDLRKQMYKLTDAVNLVILMEWMAPVLNVLIMKKNYLKDAGILNLTNN